MTNEAEKESVELTSLDHSIYWLKAVFGKALGYLMQRRNRPSTFNRLSTTTYKIWRNKIFSHCVWKGSTLDRPHDFTDTGSDTIHGVVGEHHEGP